MDTKLKKSKAIVGLISWFAGIVILTVNLFVLILEISCYENFGRQVKCVFEEDYQNMEDFRGCISDYLEIFLSMSIAEEKQEKGSRRQEISEMTAAEIEACETYASEMDMAGIYEMSEEEITDTLGWDYESRWNYESGWDYGPNTGLWDDYGGSSVFYRNDYGWSMDIKTAEQYHDNIKNDKNILYKIERSGEVLYTNEENLGFYSDFEPEDYHSYNINRDGKEITFSLPEGYNFLLYFDGQKVRIWKDGIEIDVYNDGYYREGSEWYVPGYKNFAAGEAMENSEIYIAAARVPIIYVKNNYNRDSYYYQRGIFYNMQNTIQFTKLAYLRWIYISSFAIVLLVLGYIFRKERKQTGVVIAGFTGKLWYEVKLLPLLSVICFFLCFAVKQINNFYWYRGNYANEIKYAYTYRFGLWIVTCLVIFFCGCIVGLFFNDRYYNKKAWKKSLIRTILNIFRTSSLKLPVNKRAVRNSIAMCFFIWVMCIAGILFLIGEVEGVFTEGWDSIIIAAVFFAMILFFPLLFVKSVKKTAEDMDNLVGQIQAIHDGELRESKEISESSGLSKAMENLNDIRKGMDKAVKEQTKSERMKVELVANVSHDIKTPLTSIISYVELLKQEDNLPEHVKEYILILENKSQRLKSMVQDVFEVSKAASGNLPVNMEDLDLGKLLRQTIADMEEQIKGSAVSVKPEISDAPVMINADGERMYRVFQNLIQNALQYSLEGSRVYITLREDGEAAIACVKNTSKEELNSDMDFTERFIRGDESRSDGGSGLGLSIARSFTEACGGHFKVETIADLFVVTVSFREIGESGD